ncbi:hypothetical protein [Caldimonas brevitalea]|nr:hypothetical protein [Caldimonas brevitalea]
MQHALRAGQTPGPAAPAAAQASALVVGAGGALGAAVLEQALGCGRYAQVQTLVRTPVAPALRGFEAITLAQLEATGSGSQSARADTAFIIFDRPRHANGRDAAFVRPEPDQLAALAGALKQAGVRRLLVVLPHAAALLPTALKLGLASLDEQAVAALGFEHALFVRSAQAPQRSAGSPLQRLAFWMLGQLHLMVPKQDQPVVATTAARVVVQLSLLLPEARPGTRVVPPELVWHAAQARDMTPVLQAWLHDGTVPQLSRDALPRY